MEHYYRISKAAQLIGVCSKTIRRWDARGKLECKRTLGWHRRISVFEIRRVLDGSYEGADRGIVQELRFIVEYLLMSKKRGEPWSDKN